MKPENANINKMTVTIQIKTPRWFEIRKKIGALFFMIGSWIIGFGGTEFEDERIKREINDELFLLQKSNQWVHSTVFMDEYRSGVETGLKKAYKIFFGEEYKNE